MAVLSYKSPRRRQNGFTLVEVLIAMAVLSLTVLPILGMFRMGLRDVNSGRLQTTAAFHAQAQMDLAIADSTERYSTASAQPITAIYSFTREVVAGPVAGLQRVTITVFWRDGRTNRSVSVVSLIAP